MFILTLRRSWIFFCLAITVYASFFVMRTIHQLQTGSRTFSKHRWRCELCLGATRSSRQGPNGSFGWFEFCVDSITNRRVTSKGKDSREKEVVVSFYLKTRILPPKRLTSLLFEQWNSVLHNYCQERNYGLWDSTLSCDVMCISKWPTFQKHCTTSISARLPAPEWYHCFMSLWPL